MGSTVAVVPYWILVVFCGLCHCDMSAFHWKVSPHVPLYDLVSLSEERDVDFHEDIVLDVVALSFFEHIVELDSVVPLLAESNVAHYIKSHIRRDVLK